MRRIGSHQIIDDVQQLLGVLMYAAKSWLKRGRIALRGVLEQHFAVTDDVVERRAQLVPQVSECRSIHAHNLAAEPSNAWILDSSRGRSTGLVS